MSVEYSWGIDYGIGLLDGLGGTILIVRSEMDYYPDVWHIIRFCKVGDTPVYKVMGGWYGGYGGSDSWRLNSGIVGYRVTEDRIVFEGFSGSNYHCGYNSERMSSLMNDVFCIWLENCRDSNVTVEMVPFDQYVHLLQGVREL